jgi:uncharacterized membrane protein YccC
VGTGVSLFFIAVGAILTFAVDGNTEGFNLDAVGVILMVIGLLGMLWSLVVWDDWRPLRRRSSVDDDVVVRRDPVVIDDEVPARRTVRRVYR